MSLRRGTAPGALARAVLAPASWSACGRSTRRDARGKRRLSWRADEGTARPCSTRPARARRAGGCGTGAAGPAARPSADTRTGSGATCSRARSGAIRSRARSGATCSRARSGAIRSRARSGAICGRAGAAPATAITRTRRATGPPPRHRRRTPRHRRRTPRHRRRTPRHRRRTPRHRRPHQRRERRRSARAPIACRTRTPIAWS